jgi:DNA-binding CsgD family transcriptional regulator
VSVTAAAPARVAHAVCVPGFTCQDRGKIVSEIVGREAELSRLRAFIDETPQAPSALMLEGDLGIGKSTLWLAALEHARERGLRVVAARPAEAERGLPYAALGDLLDGPLDDVLSELAAPRRRALEVALLLEEPGRDDAVDARALAVAVRDALELLADGGPVLLAVDDVQWLDPASAAVIAFALRRLNGGVRVLLARRLGDGGASPVDDALRGSLERLRVGPLSVGALHRFLHDQLGIAYPRQTLLRVHERSGGNPFFALELARVLDPDLDPLLPLPVPETLEELVRGRLTGLPAATREALALVSAVGAPSESLLRRAGVAADALEPALQAHVVARDAGTIRFTHPLLSSVVYRDLGDDRRSVHARIADAVDDPITRARHLALAQDRPDPEAAAVLDMAAGVAAGRGLSAVAAELAEHALRLTPPAASGERHRRALAAARAHRDAGEWTRARSILAELVAEPEIGPLRAEGLMLLAELESIERSIPLLEEALDEAAARPSLQSVLCCRLAWAARWGEGPGYALRALELADELDDDVLRARAQAVLAVFGWFAADPEAPQDLPARAHDFASAVGGDQLVREATLGIANTLAVESRRNEARAFFHREHREWRDRDEPRSAAALWGLSWVEFWAGRWERAAEHALAAHDTSIQYGLEMPQDHLPIALVALHRGELALARRHSERALSLSEGQFVQMLHPPQHVAIMGLAALWNGEPHAVAADWLAKADQRAEELGWRESSVRWWTPDRAELLLEDGRIEDAVRLVDAWEADALRVGRVWVLAHVERCRGLIAGAEGAVERAVSLLERAVELHAGVGDPYGEARALFALGVVRRRERQQRAAREALVAALAGFERLGAATWVQRTRAELGAIGGRTRQDGLTPAERRVAALVAEGRTNREVAAALFLGERTVASHLTHVYAKLGVRSRTELARTFGASAPKDQTF